jgi:hypothetical protein
MDRLKTGVKSMSKRLILSVDPGKASGICLFAFDSDSDPELLWSGEYQQNEYAKPIREAIASSIMSDVKLEIVCERFTINAQTVRNSQAPYSLEQIGILKQCMMDIGLDPDTIIFQSPADAKAMFPNPKLKKLGYWHKGGEGHALDAIRHAVLRLAKSGWKPIKLLEE